MKTSLTKPIKNQKGQLVLEAILLMVVMVGLTITLTSFMKNSNFLQNLVQKPWTVLAGMVESGTWQPAQVARYQHPNNKGRNLSFSGDIDTQ